MLKITKYHLLLVSVAVIFQGCMENNADPVYDFKGETTTEMVVHFELNGDHINTIDVPWLIDANELFNNLTRCLVIDTRPAELFIQGHIDGSQNIAPGALLKFMQSTDTSRYPKIVIISATGQAAAYYTTLLRLAGYNNIYTLKWGMTSWNTEFAGLWINSCKNSPAINLFTNEPGKRNSPGNLPQNDFGTNKESTRNRILQRISELLSAGFNDYDSIISKSQLAGSPSIDYLNVNLDEGINKDIYLVCYANDELYNVTELFNPYRGLGHPQETVLYSVASSLSSNEFLYTLPANDEIVMYCYNGHLSAAAVAYLRVLGYKAKSLLFGAHTLFYNRLDKYSPRLDRFVFRKSLITDHPYVTGY